MLISSTGLPDDTQLANANASQITYNIPQLPAAYQVTSTRVSGLFYVWYGNPVPVTEKQVKADVSEMIKRLRSTAWAASNVVEKEPLFVEFRCHKPFKLSVGAEEIESGFYDRLEGCEYPLLSFLSLGYLFPKYVLTCVTVKGHQNTWWTGAAFLSHDSSVLWNFTSALLPKLW